MKAAVLFMAAICAAQATPAAGQDDPELLEKVRATMLRALKSLPNYVCLETTERLRAPKLKDIEKAKKLDSVELEVAHVGNKEMYSLPGRNMFSDTQLTQALNFGLVGTGAYASQLIDVLFGSGTQFRWVGRETLGGRTVLRWDYTLPKAKSSWTLGTRDRSARVGSEGSLWADAATFSVVRLSARATSLPARFPMKSAARAIDYARVRIGSGDALLPSAVEDVVETSGGVNINRSRFGNCREFSSTSSITFESAGAPAGKKAAESTAAAPATAASGTPASGTPAAINSAPAAPASGDASGAGGLKAIPKGVRIKLALDAHLRSDDTVIGSPVNAHVISDVRRGKEVLIPKGTAVRGLLREYEKANDGFHSYLFTIAIEFSELVLPTGAIPFDAYLKSVDAPAAGMCWLVPSEHDTMTFAYFQGPGIGTVKDRNQVVSRKPTPGLAVLIFRDQPAFDLYPGTPMTWTTVETETR